MGVLTGCSFGFHRWSKWERYVWVGKVKYELIGKPPAGEWTDMTENRQKRHCERCGLHQDVKMHG